MKENWQVALFCLSSALVFVAMGCSAETFRSPPVRVGASSPQVTSDPKASGSSANGDNKTQNSTVAGTGGGGNGVVDQGEQAESSGGMGGGTSTGSNGSGMGNGGTSTGSNGSGMGNGGTSTGSNDSGMGNGGIANGGANCVSVNAKVSFEPYLPDTAVNGIIATTEAGTPMITQGENRVTYGPNATVVSHWAITKDNVSTDAYCRSKGYDAGLAVCKKSAENIEGIIVSNLTSTVAGQQRWALGCNWGVGVVRTPDAVACVTFAKSCPVQGTANASLWISYSGSTSPEAACKAAGFSDATALCKGSSVVQPQKGSEGTIAWNGTVAKCMYGDAQFGNVSQLLCAPKSTTNATPHTEWVNIGTDTALNGTGTGPVPEFSTPTQAFFNNFTIVNGVVSGAKGNFSFHAQNKSASEICKSAGFSAFSGFCETTTGKGGLVQNKSTIVNGEARWASACLTGGGTTSSEMTFGKATRIQCLK